MRGKVFYAFSTLFFVGLIYSVVNLSKVYQKYFLVEDKLDGVETVLRKVERDSLTPREWREAKELFKESEIDLDNEETPRMLTVFNQYYLQRKYLETNAGNTELKKITWRDVIDSDFDKFEEVKSDLQKFESSYLDFYESINSWKDQLIVAKVVANKKLDQSRNITLGVSVLFFLFLSVFYYLFKESNYHVRLDIKDQSLRKSTTREQELILSGEWDLAEIVEDMCHELKLRNKSVNIFRKTESVLESKKAYYRFEKSLRPLIKFIEFLSMDSRLSIRTTLWKSSNKTYFFIDIDQFRLDLHHYGSGVAANKLQNIEDTMGDFDAELKLFNLVDKNCARISIEFYNSEQKARINKQISHKAA